MYFLFNLESTQTQSFKSNPLQLLVFLGLVFLSRMLLENSLTQTQNAIL